MLQVYRLYIGLSQANHSKAINRDRVIAIIARSIASFTIYDAQGFFRGEVENTLVITIAHESSNYIKSLAYDLCVRLKQEGIGLEYDGLYHRITQDGPIQTSRIMEQTYSPKGEDRGLLS